MWSCNLQMKNAIVHFLPNNSDYPIERVWKTRKPRTQPFAWTKESDSYPQLERQKLNEATTKPRTTRCLKCHSWRGGDPQSPKSGTHPHMLSSMWRICHQSRLSLFVSLLRKNLQRNNDTFSGTCVCHN